MNTLSSEWKSTPLIGKIGCYMVWTGSMVFYNASLGELVKLLSIIILSTGGFMVFITNRKDRKSQLLIIISAVGFMLGIIVAFIRTRASG
jgi:hypothetical protein